MIDEARAYGALMTVLRERLPELHDQIADEVARGKELRGTDIERSEREGRDRRLGDKKLGRIAESDISVFPYSDEERLDLLMDALRTSAETLDHSLDTLSNLLTEQEVRERRLYFRRPESDETATVQIPLAREEVSPEAEIARRLSEIDRSVEVDRRERGYR